MIYSLIYASIVRAGIMGFRDGGGGTFIGVFRERI